MNEGGITLAKLNGPETEQITMPDPGQLNYSICIVGSGTRFLSGISYYTLRLANTLAATHVVSVILMRQLLPTFFYPGRKRVGAKLTHQEFAQAIKVFDGVDWYWLPSIIGAISLLAKGRPQVVVFQWWTGVVLHSYLLLALVARLFGIKVVIEFHEAIDRGEAKLAPVWVYVRLMLPWLIRLASGFIVHSEYDRMTLNRQYGLGKRPVEVILHGPFDHYRLPVDTQPYRAAPVSCCNLLFFGVIRPFKGLEDLIRAFDLISEDEINNYWLTVVGETWEGWTLPTELITKSRYKDRITFINRYVKDEEVAAYFAGADAVVLPYHSSSASGPLHVAMSHGLPVVVTQVGGLPEAASGYQGAVFVPPRNPASLRDAIYQVREMIERRFVDPRSWDHNACRLSSLLTAIGLSPQTGTAQKLVPG